MAIRFDLQQFVSASPEHVFRVLTDLDAAGEWMPGFVSAERVGETRGLGERWRETRRIMGKEATQEFEVTELDPPRTFGLRMQMDGDSSRGGEYVFRYRLTPQDGGTMVDLHGEVRGLGRLASFFGRLMVAMSRGAIARDLQAMREHAERTAAARTA